VGAKTVKGPSPLSVPTNPAALTAVTKVVKSPAATALSTMSFWAKSPFIPPDPLQPNGINTKPAKSNARSTIPKKFLFFMTFPFKNGPNNL